MNGSSSLASTSLVRSGWSSAGAMNGYLWLSNSRKYRSSRTSMLDGWIISGRYGSSPILPVSSSALISRSESSMRTSLLSGCRVEHGHWARPRVCRSPADCALDGVPDKLLRPDQEDDEQRRHREKG